ncbi:MAG: hypothetical protein K6G72_02610 [Lachnospiraceae bacterium]|nr:hypothetical protein [Lachnospiraceae bacterium]
MRRIDRMGKMLTKAIAVALSFSIMFGQAIGAHADELNTATALYEEGIALVEAAEEEVEDADFEEIEAADMTDTASDLGDYDDAAKELADAAEATIADADTANTSDSRDEAYAAKDSAEANLSEAETKLNESLTTLENAQAAYEEADAAQKEAEAAYAEAEAALNDTESDTAAAREALEAAKEAIAVQEEKKNELENIQAQYYGTMVQYFRRVLGNNVVYNEDGTVNIEESTKKVTTTGNNNFADKGDKAYFAYATLLTEELLEYMINGREDVDPETSDFKFGEQLPLATTRKTAQEAVVFKNTVGKDQVADKIHTDVSGNTVYPGEEKDVYHRYVSGDSGRHNQFAVTYKDISGNEHIEYYNFILKSEKFGDTADVENGSIYLARVEQNEDGTWVNTRVKDENNYDDYSKLTAAVEALNQINDYNKAKEDVEAALARVAALEATLADLQESSSATKANLDLVRSALDAAKEELEAAEANKESLQATYEEAKAAVESIDLSRFNIVVVPAPATETPVSEPAAEPAVEPAVETPAVITILPEETPLAPVLAAPAGEEEDEVEEVTAVVAIDENDTPLTAGPAEVKAPEVATEVAAVIGTVQLIANIDGEIVPLAGFAFAESMKKVWWIWILIIVTAITMYIIYKRNTEDEETETH